ncbi:MAG: hypothetical protein ACREBW_00145, partial [Candidatus Micrarchaeaceae archaeon]
VAHHGSITGYHPEIWAKMLTSKPLSILTPFVRGHVKLPTTADIERLKKVSGSVHSTSGASKKAALPREIERRLSVVCKDIHLKNPGFGAVRMRKRPSEITWRCEHFGNARRIA